MKVALVLVNYNGKQYLPDLFASLQSLEFPRDACDIFFVDNASSDGTKEILKLYKSTKHCLDLRKI